jgi:hypothetical protein
MADSFIVYIEHLELFTFFSGYPLVYTFARFLTDRKQGQRTRFSFTLLRSLSGAYALVGSVFFLLWIREKIIQSDIQNMAPGFFVSPLKVWGLLAVCFWLPALGKKPLLSLLHSLVFFVLFFTDLIIGVRSTSEKDMISNDMKAYTISLLLNIVCLVAVFTSYWIFEKIRTRR